MTTTQPKGKPDAREQKALDKSIEDSFPASDPSSVTRAPRDKRYTAVPPKKGRDRKTSSKSH